MVQLLWAMADAVGVRLAAVHRDAEIEIARHGERQRAEFLRGLVFGSVAPAEIRRLGPAYHLTPDQRYVALRGRPANGSTAEQLVRAITAGCRAIGHHAFVDVLEGDVVGVAPRAPALVDCPGIVGAGPPADLAAIEPSFATASRVLEVAERFGRPGMYRLEDLSLRVAVAAEDELGELLVGRYLRPLDKLGAKSAAVLETVAAFIEHGLSVKATAGPAGARSRSAAVHAGVCGQGPGIPQKSVGGAGAGAARHRSGPDGRGRSDPCAGPSRRWSSGAAAAGADSEREG